MSMNRGPSGPRITSADSAPCQSSAAPSRAMCSRASGRSRPSLWLDPPAAPSRTRSHAWNATSSPRANTDWTMASARPPAAGPARLLVRTRRAARSPQRPAATRPANRPGAPPPTPCRSASSRTAATRPARPQPVPPRPPRARPRWPPPSRAAAHANPGQRTERRHLVLDPGQRGEGGHRGGQPGVLDPVPGQRHDGDLFLHRQQQPAPRRAATSRAASSQPNGSRPRAGTSCTRRTWRVIRHRHSPPGTALHLVTGPGQHGRALSGGQPGPVAQQYQHDGLRFPGAARPRPASPPARPAAGSASTTSPS